MGKRLSEAKHFLSLGYLRWQQERWIAGTGRETIPLEAIALTHEHFDHDPFEEQISPVLRMMQHILGSDNVTLHGPDGEYGGSYALLTVSDDPRAANLYRLQDRIQKVMPNLAIAPMPITYTPEAYFGGRAERRRRIFAADTTMRDSFLYAESYMRVARGLVDALNQRKEAAIQQAHRDFLILFYHEDLGEQIEGPLLEAVYDGRYQDGVQLLRDALIRDVGPNYLDEQLDGHMESDED